MTTCFLMKWIQGLLLMLWMANLYASSIDTPQQAFNSGNYPQAIQAWKSELAVQPDTVQQIKINLGLTAAYQHLGDYVTATETATHALHLADTSQNLEYQALAHSALGDVLIALQYTAKAVSHFQTAEQIARDLNHPQILAHILNNMGNLYALDGNYRDASPFYIESAELTADLKNPLAYIQILTNLARAQLHEMRANAARSTLKRARIHLPVIASGYQRGMAAITLGELYLRLYHESDPQPDDLQYAAQMFQQARSVDSEDHRLAAYAAGYLAQVYVATNQLDDALQFIREALFLAQNHPDLLYRWEWWQGRVHERQGDAVSSLQSYQSAFEHLLPIRPGLLIGRDAQRVFTERVRPVYYDYAGALLKNARGMEHDPQHQKATQDNAINILEALKIAELQDYFQDECMTHPRRVRLDLINSHTAVLYPVLLRDRIELLVSIGGKYSQYSIDVPDKQINSVLNEFQRNLQIRTRWIFVNQAQQLYNWLIAPARATLDAAHIDTLVFVPDGALRMIPPAALFDGKGYLIEHFNVVVTPSLSLTEPRALPKKNIQILLSGLSEGVAGFSPLPSVPLEISNIKNEFDNSRVLMDNTFLVQNINDSLQATPYNIIHFATHGEFNHDPTNTFLLAYDGKLTLDRLETFLRFSQDRQESVELLTLSACQTAVGDERAALGLAGIAIKSGARSALASLWFVNDESTSLLMQDFYRNLRAPSMSKASALRAAQRHLLEHQTFRHPAYWSPFLLIGNWL